MMRTTPGLGPVTVILLLALLAGCSTRPATSNEQRATKILFVLAGSRERSGLEAGNYERRPRTNNYVLA